VVITNGLQAVRELLFLHDCSGANKSRFLAALVMTIPVLCGVTCRWNRRSFDSGGEAPPPLRMTGKTVMHVIKVMDGC
jgi:hypothetical protein